MKRHEKGEMELAEWMHLSADMDGERMWKVSLSRKWRQPVCYPPYWMAKRPASCRLARFPLASRRTETVSGTGYQWLSVMRDLGIWCLPCRRYGTWKNGTGYYLSAGASQYGIGSRSGADYLPTSLLGNWQREIQRFAPDLTLHVHHGVRRLRGRLPAGSSQS